MKHTLLRTMHRLNDQKKKVSIFLLIIVLLLVTTNFPGGKVHAATLSTSSIQMSDSRPSHASTTYTVTFTFPSTTTIECIDIIIADTTAHITTSPNPATTAPAVFSNASAVKGTISGGGLTSGNYTIYNGTNGIIQLEDATGHASTATAVTIPITTITNTSAATFYAQVATYTTLSTHTCSGLADTSPVMAFTTTSGVTTTVSVDPSASLSVADKGTAVNGATGSSFATTTSTTIPFGTVAAGTNKDASQNLTVSTNAAHGYSLYVSDTGTMTDTNSDTFRDQSGTPGSAASFDGSSSQSSFAYTAAGAGVTFGSNLWAGLANAQAQFAIATRTSAQNSDVTPIQFRVEPSNTQPPGTYTTTVIYTLAPSY